MLKLLNQILVVFGYKNLDDFLQTTILLKSFMFGKIILTSIGISTLSIIIQDFIGLKPLAYLSLVILFILEFCTGVSASVFIKKEKFNSLKMGRIVLKIFVYSTILGLFNIFNHEIGGWTVLNFTFNFFEWTYFVVLNILVLQLLVSVMENCEVLGFKEVTVLLKIFRKRVDVMQEFAEDLQPDEKPKEEENEK